MASKRSLYLSKLSIRGPWSGRWASSASQVGMLTTMVQEAPVDLQLIVAHAWAGRREGRPVLLYGTLHTTPADVAAAHYHREDVRVVG